MTIRHINGMLFAGVAAIQSFGDLARIGAFVVDVDDGQPIPNVMVTASFDNDNGWKAWTEAAPINHDTQMTDIHGRCRLSGKTNNGEVGCWVDGMQQGYYGTRKSVNFNFKHKTILGTWQPDNLVATIALQRIEHPVPLFVKDVRLDGSRDITDRIGVRLSYDLVKGDWLPPVGNGRYADITFERLPRKKLGHAELQGRPDINGESFRDEISVVFAGNDNGILNMHSSLLEGIPIRSSPDVGFTSVYTLWQEMDANMKYKNGNDKDKCLCFRIRTLKDERGQIKSSYYGKIYGDINIQLGYAYSIGGFGFLYYLNPTPNDRNLEWDMKNNLCPNPGKIGQFQP